MSDKILLGRIKGLIKEYKAIDSKLVSTVEGLKTFPTYLEDCKSNSKTFEEAGEQLAKYKQLNEYLLLLKDDILITSSKISELLHLTDIKKETIELTEDEIEVSNACKTFSAQTFFLEDGELKIKDSEYREYLESLKKEMAKAGSTLEQEYQAMMQS